ncbi:glycerol kinase GlpK [Aliidiomarina halalkaliphila]|uniref:glycerol kinase n=1 Tax=Aliidiomarina halalkaliphila TaxID=2593535 RepID=A0A552X2V5_9GAMM|nr:glycerol kinase GlpK [Aliidiomarina halalkaliphila]TRW48943.1 glycerol kinase GlpK [Aliidiomarina halalkaliphila]
MPQGRYILALDQGTTSSRAMVYHATDESFEVVGRGQHEFDQHFPDDGWVEHDPEDIWQTTLDACKDAIEDADIDASDLAGIGITNQRETTVIWERDSGKPIYPAIVWQDRRTAAYCRQLKDNQHEAMVQEHTGLLLDPYFSGTKIHWILEHVDGARKRAEAGELCFGTIDSFLLWRLTDGKVHATDATNASRTLLMNLETRAWDNELLALFDIPSALLPEIRDNADHFGDVACSTLLSTSKSNASVPVLAMIGDQQGALFGQACFSEGQMKSTYGTGCFALVNTGDRPRVSENRLLSTMAYQLEGKPTYALEGSIFMAGAIVQWLRDKLGMINEAAETESLSEGVPWQQSEMLIPAFTGLGAPYWDPEARAALFGMTRDTGRSQIAAAALRSVTLQTRDLLKAMDDDGQPVDELRVDGGMTENNWFMQALADMTGHPVLRANTTETTVRGAALLAGLQAGVFSGLKQIEALCRADDRWTPDLDQETRDKVYARWLAAVEKVR